ncbi:hypothetical protein KV112_22345, partial [Mycolicibacter sp. MYC123]
MADAAVQPEALQPNRIRTGLSAALLILGLLLPWNIHFGLGIAGTLTWVLVILVVATLLSLSALAVGESPLRMMLTAPYLVLVAAFTVFAIVMSVRCGGTGTVAPGVGPGAWSGLAGALLAAQTGTTTTDGPRSARVRRTLGWTSIALAVLATLFNLYYRTRFVLPGIGGEAGVQNLTTAVAALLYGVVALAPVIVAGRWIVSDRPETRLATVLLGGATLIAATLIWFLPVGRLLDAFHGIAQNTGTVSVGYDGYLAWVAVAALIGTPVVRSAWTAGSQDLWRKVTRSCLMLIAVWCGGKAVLRITDVMLTGVLSLPTPPYSATMLMLFDLLTAVLALWLFVNSRSGTAPRTVPILGILVVLTVCRVILGVALVPRIDPLNPGTVNPVYGNHLVQQITSTFDVALCVLALALLVAAIGVGARPSGTAAAPRPAQAQAPVPA